MIRTSATPGLPAAPERLRWAVVRIGPDPAVRREHAGERRALVVSSEPIHRARLATILPITAVRADPRYPGEVALAVGEAGQARPGVILCHQVRTIPLDRLAGRTPDGFVTSPATRAAVREALAHHLGLDIPPVVDGARVTG
jgi:mRNA-degrading endonuclease toxin of MazEF toxin-antitoxin module